MSLKNLLYTFLFLQINFSTIIAQSITAPLLTDATPVYNLFVENPTFDQQLTKDFLADATYLKLNTVVLTELRKNRPSQLLLKLPQTNGATLKVLLQRKNILSDGFTVQTPDHHGDVEYTPRLFYQGRIMGSGKSIVAISIFEDWMMGVLTSNETTYVLGHLQPEIYPASKEYVLYEEANLLISNKFTCATGQLENRTTDSNDSDSNAKNNANKSVKVYFEADYHMFQEKNSNVTSTTDYVTGLFNVVNAIYDAESIIAEISEIFVWTQDDPYPDNSNALTSFRDRLSGNYNGDLAHLVTRDPGGNGGVAYVDALCENFFGIAYSNVNSGYNNNPVPTYSWTTMVVTHEMGHNLGSLHTQSCTWPGGAIDNCVATEDGFCEPGPEPTSGGTIMSYCHLSSAGINFNNGFGPLPGDRIRREVNNASCLTAPTNSGNNENEEEPSPTINLTSAGTDKFTITDNVVSIRHRMINAGSEASGDYNVVYFLTEDERFDPADPRIESKAIPGTAANTFSNQYTSTVDLSTIYIENGTYHLGYFIDSNEEILESDELDNGFYWLEQQIVIENSLALTLSDFNASAQENYNLINWRTANEAGTLKFHIQRSSNGKSAFKTIETIFASGNSNQSISYAIKDKNPLKTAYYRLQTENQDGSLEYSELVLVERATLKGLTVHPFFPNPARDQFTIQFTSPSDLETVISLMDITGQVLQQIPIISNNDITIHQLSATTLPSGIYFVHIENAAGIVSQKIIIE